MWLSDTPPHIPQDTAELLRELNSPGLEDGSGWPEDDDQDGVLGEDEEGVQTLQGKATSAWGLDDIECE